MTPRQEWDLRGQLAEQGMSPTQINQYIQSEKSGEKAPVNQPAAEPKKQAGSGFLKSLIKDPVKELLVRPAVRTAQAGIALFGGEKGKQFAEKDQTVKLPLLGDFNIPAQKTGMAGVKQIAGDAAKSGSYLYAPAKTVSAVKTGFSGLVKQGAKEGAKAGFVGGAAYSGGEAAQQNKSAGEIFTETLKGGIAGGATGAVLGGGAGALSAGLNKMSRSVTSKADDSIRTIPNKAVDDLEMKYEEIFTGTKPAKKAFEKSTARGKTPARFLAEHGFVVEVKGGKIDPANTITQIQENAKPLNEVLQDILQAKDKQLPEANYVSLETLRQKTKQALSTDRNRATGDFSKMMKQVDEIIDDLEIQFGEKVNYSTLNTIKQGQWDNAGFDMTRPKFTSDVHRKIGTAAKNTLEEVVEETDIKTLNSYIGDHYDAITNLEKINGNAVKGGKLGNYFGRTLGAVVGSQGGFLGSVAGAYAGDVVASIMQNNYIASPVKRMMLQKLMQKAGVGSPQYQAALQALEQINASASHRLLPAGNDALKGNRNVILNKDVINLPKQIPDSPDKPFKGKGALSR